MTIAYIGECKTFARCSRFAPAICYFAWAKLNHKLCDRIKSMVLAVFIMRVLEVMFFVGLVGSAVVVLISFYEDAIELFGKD